jgi:hypothetical protein
MARECHLCGSTKLAATSGRYRSYRCARCINASAAGRRARDKYQQRRIRVCNEYYGFAKTPALADAIHAHIRRRLSEFKQRFAARE